MRIGLQLLLGAVLWLSFGAGAAWAGSLVEFPNVSDRAPPLVGYLARPDTALPALLGGRSATMPYPAVVLLHECHGISSHTVKIADRISTWGYVTLTVDSLGPRRIPAHCGSLFLEQAFDAYAALRYLSQQDFVDPVRVAVFGQSLGGASTLYAIDRDLAAQYFDQRFRAAIAYYPGCAIGVATMTAPTLILIGEADDLTRAQSCREMVANARTAGAPITLTVYPAAHHAFDVAEFQPGVRSRGHWLEYNEPVARDAEGKVRAFLAAHLGSADTRKPATQ
jgi:dienelactone hydrolase